MSGSLPGVESARRRRMSHRDVKSSESSRRSSALCLYVATSFTDFHITPPIIPSSMEMRRVQQHDAEDEDWDGKSGLDAAAKEAKKRLDLRLQTQWKSPTTKR